ncbi:MAG: filamentous hemagglutinin N-terminal domain-containing protein [Sulfuritalea sp.]|nr:filamentous hemagglutinin N-terminal domain-containing protein [Sulfuritalea sp.]
MSYKDPSPKRRLSTSVRLGVAAVAACFIAGPLLAAPPVPATNLPTGFSNLVGIDPANIVAGANSLNILTSTNRSAADVANFNIAAGYSVNITQPTVSSDVLFRVLSNNPSVIYGSLSSNGGVYLVNHSGIFVGPSGQIDVARFVATTLTVRNEDFLAGRQLFVNDGSAQNVINQGEIRTPSGGSVYLIGSNVTNEGIITTPGGETILAAGATVSLIDSATPGVKVDITGAAGNATNLGQITAEAGRIGIAGVIVRNSGTLNASSAVSEGGRIFLKASQDAYVDGKGRIVTTGTKGGSVEVLGNKVTVTDNAEIDASGDTGGGRILVGGDYQGKNPEVQNASTSYFGPAARLRADATEVGAGGTVIVWADDTTRAYGNISARGGALGGDGGLVETSGHRYLDISGARVDTRAPNGKTGNWLLDPVDVSILQYGGMPTSGSAPFAPTSNSVIWAEDISAALGTTDVTIRTDGGSAGLGNITVTGASISGANRLILAAYGGAGATGDIAITGSNINLGTGFRALAGWNGAATYYGSDVIAGTGNIAINGSMIHASSYVDLHAGNDISLGSSGAYGSWVQSFGNMLVTAGHDLNLFGGSGNISGPQGPGVMLRGDTSQTIKVGNQILLQAGSANNTTHSGSTMYGASVAIQSGGIQDISAGTIKVYAGSSGHDNSAEIQASGNQSISIYGGVLDVRGGGDASASVYGGQGSYNNAARIQHGQSFYGGDVYTGSGDQTLTLYGGASVILQAGSGTGVLGYYGSDCYASGAGDLCRGSSNDAHLQNGIGAQTLNFISGGAISITGGSAGRQNWAGISNQSSATTQLIFGNPDITLTGGSGGGSAVSYGGDTFQLSNDAGINSDGTGAQTVYAGTITINGGNATYGGAGLGSDSGNGLTITTTGDLSMYGGSSSAGDPFAAATYIGNKAGGAINLNVGGNLYVKAGSGSAAPVLIGSIDGPTSVAIATAGNVSIIADGSQVGIGTDSASYGASVNIAAGGNLTVADSATRGVRIGSLADSASATDVTLQAGGDIAIGSATGYGALVGVKTPSGISNVTIRAGEYGGGNLLLAATSRIKAGGQVALSARQLAATNGNITQNSGGIIYGGNVGFNAEGSASFNGNVTATTGMISGLAGFAYGGQIGYSTSPSAYGGNLVFGSTSVLTAPGIAFASAGDLTMNGQMQAGTGGIQLSAGSYRNLGNGYSTLAGGDVFIGGNLQAGGYVNVSASVGYDSFAKGNIVQSAGSISSASGNINIEGGGNVTLNGSTSAYGGSGSIRSGFANLTGTPYGGNINLGGDVYAANGLSLYAISGGSGPVGNGHIVQNGGSLASNGTIGLYADGSIDLGARVATPGSLYIYAGLDNRTSPGYADDQSAYGGDVGFGASSKVYGGHVEIVANRGKAGGSLGNIRQEAGGLLHVTGVTSLYAYAAGNADLLGATIVDAGASVSINAGYDYPGYGGQAFADRHVSIDSLNAYGSSVNLYATGRIFANTQDVGSIYANISNSSGGGIEIANTGSAEPLFINLNDGALANSKVTFTHSGSDLTLDSSRSFSTYGGAGAINVSALSGNLNYLGGGALSGSSVILSGGNELNIDGSLSASGALGLAAGGMLNVNNAVHADSITLTAPTVNLLSGGAHAANDAIAIGSAINIGAGTTRLTGANVLLRGATEGTGTLNLDGGVAATGGNLEFNLGSVNAYGGHLFAPVDIIGFVTGDILLGGGAYIHAGNDVWLTHSGTTSLLSMSSGGHVLAGMPTTIHLDFPNRDTSGVVTDGSPGSGLFVVVNGVVTPATPGNGLELTLRPVQTSTDPCVANPDLCKPPAPKETPIETAPPAPELAKTDPTQPLLDPNATTGGTEGSFGDTGTTDQPPSETKKDEGTTTSSAKDEGSKDDKKDEKDEKDKKDKKSDEAKDEKKDEKPAQKKVAQCT